GFVEEHRGAALGLRRRGGRAHLAGVVGEVAAHAIDAADRERAAAAHAHARHGRRGDDVVGVHGPQRRIGWPGLSTTRYSASSTSPRAEAGRRRKAARSRPNETMAAPTTRPT